MRCGFLINPHGIVTLIPLDEEQMHAAALTYQTYGRGNHPAGLNCGDTFPYALA